MKHTGHDLLKEHYWTVLLLCLGYISKIQVMAFMKFAERNQCLSVNWNAWALYYFWGQKLC